MKPYPDRPVVGVGAVVLDGAQVLLIKRGHAPLKGQWSLPGGGVEIGETLEQAIAREVLEETGLTVEVGPMVEVLDYADSDVAKILHQYGVDPSRLTSEISRSLDKLKTGNARTPAISPTILKLMTEAWTLGSIDYGAQKIRSGFTFLAMLTHEEISAETGLPIGTVKTHIRRGLIRVRERLAAGGGGQ